MTRLAIYVLCSSLVPACVGGSGDGSPATGADGGPTNDDFACEAPRRTRGLRRGSWLGGAAALRAASAFMR